MMPQRKDGLGEGEEYELRGDADRLYDPEAQAKVIDWRVQELERAGYDKARASALAIRRDVDLHVACDLVKRGATPEQAALILL